MAVSSFEQFMKKNKKAKSDTFYAATASLCDENGKPLEWQIRALTTKESEEIRKRNTVDVPVPDKPGIYRQKVDDDYVPSLVCAAVVYPNLHDAALQDSYGVKTPEDLLIEMVDNPTEYADLVRFVQSYSGIDTSLDEEVKQAKN